MYGRLRDNVAFQGGRQGRYLSRGRLLQGIFPTVLGRIEQTCPLAHESRLFLEFLFICVHPKYSALMLIDAVLPTSHLFDH